MLPPRSFDSQSCRWRYQMEQLLYRSTPCFCMESADPTGEDALDGSGASLSLPAHTETSFDAHLIKTRAGTHEATPPSIAAAIVTVCRPVWSGPPSSLRP